ncbi:hypothetical protein BDF21DRAFT_397752 [Thamnidium elegans]|nr:hypothetical protein BDF21DRAFT_397752 [Thamnidium elegans]
MCFLLIYIYYATFNVICGNFDPQPKRGKNKSLDSLGEPHLQALRKIQTVFLGTTAKILSDHRTYNRSLVLMFLLPIMPTRMMNKRKYIMSHLSMLQKTPKSDCKNHLKPPKPPNFSRAAETPPAANSAKCTRYEFKFNGLTFDCCGFFDKGSINHSLKFLKESFYASS